MVKELKYFHNVQEDLVGFNTVNNLPGGVVFKLEGSADKYD
jgi:hypothetical protein